MAGGLPLLSLGLPKALDLMEYFAPMDGRKRLRAGNCAHCCCCGTLTIVPVRRVKAFICDSCAGVLWESELHNYLGFGAQPHVVSNASIQC